MSRRPVRGRYRALRTRSSRVFETRLDRGNRLRSFPTAGDTELELAVQGFGGPVGREKMAVDAVDRRKGANRKVTDLV